MNSQLLQDLMALKAGKRDEVQYDLGITFPCGQGESKQQFCKRLLTEVEHQGKVRHLEQLLNE